MSEAAQALVHHVLLPPRQRGMALIIAIVFMLLLSILGLSAMQNTILQERMAGNHRDHGMAFQAAEAAMREAERLVESGVTESLEKGESLTGEYDFSSIADLSKDPSYKITYEEIRKYSDDNLCEQIVRDYLIQSTGYGGSLSSQVELEVLYVRDPCW